MTGVRDDFLATARTAADLLRDPAVAAAWESPSALAEFSVAGLAGHLASQVLILPQVLAGPAAEEPTISLTELYSQLKWIDAPLDADVNVKIREGGEARAADGPAALAAEVDATIKELAETLPAEADRQVRMPFWGPWSLVLDDLVITRMMELVVHSDDLAVSVGVPTPELPQSAVDTVVVLLSRVAVRRHGATNVLRALSRVERAPANITAF